jgi:RimJ/RimL family protein N-acetyltransferase
MGACPTIETDRLYSCILPDNLPSQAVARRLGFALLEERVMAWYPDALHGIWVGERGNG